MREEGCESASRLRRCKARAGVQVALAKACHCAVSESQDDTHMLAVRRQLQPAAASTAVWLPPLLLLGRDRRRLPGQLPAVLCPLSSRPAERN